MAFHTAAAIVNGSAIINLHGTFDINAVSNFLKTGLALLETSGLAEIEIHFDDVNFIDSSALGGLLQLREKAGARNCGVVLCGYCGAARVTLETANFPMLFKTRPAKITPAEKPLAAVLG